MNSSLNPVLNAYLLLRLLLLKQNLVAFGDFRGEPRRRRGTSRKPFNSNNQGES